MFTVEDNTYISGTGQRLRNIHPETDSCTARGCTVHAPSDHAMRDFPTHFRADRGLMERICECSVGHPDPDHLAFVREFYGEDAAKTESVHGCCGCCSVSSWIKLT